MATVRSVGSPGPMVQAAAHAMDARELEITVIQAEAVTAR